MSFVPALVAGLGALGGLFGNRSQTQQNTGTQQSNSGFLNMPAMTAEGGGVFFPTADAYLKNLATDTDLSGYRAGQQYEINSLANTRNKALEFELNRRGISGSSPYGSAASANLENQRYSDITKLNQSIPLMAQQIMQSKINQGIDLFSKIPYGQSGTSFQNTQQQGNVTQPGNMLGGLFGNLAPILAYLMGQGAFGGSGNNSNPLQIQTSNTQRA